MKVYELDFPGSLLDISDSNEFCEIRGFISDLESCFAEAVVVFNLYEARNDEPLKSTEELFEEWAIKTQRAQQIENKIARELGIQDTPFNFEQSQNVRHLAEIELKREKWNANVLPRSYKSALTSIYAKAFVSALDMIGKLLKTLCISNPNLPDDVYEQAAQYKEFFKGIKDVRDSIQHHEERTRRLGRVKGKTVPLDIKPGQKGNIKTVGNSLVLDNHNGNKFGTTIADGSFVEIEISDFTMKLVQGTIQNIIDAFSWTGFRDHHPN